MRTPLTVTGCVRYVDADNSQRPGRNLWVRVWDDEVVLDELLWEGVAGSDGCWTATGLTLEEECCLKGNQDIYVSYSTWTTPAAKVMNRDLNYYAFRTTTTNDVPSSPHDTGTWIPPATPSDYRPAFRVYAYLEEAWQFDCASGVGQSCASEPQVEAIIDTTAGTGAYYMTGDNRIRIEVNGDYDRSRDVVTHERGHYVMDRLLYEDAYWPPGSGGAHLWCGLYTQGLAWTEGWATYYAIAKGNWQNPNDVSFEYGSGASVNIESGTFCSSSVTGDTNEYRVAGALWDLRDGQIDGFDNYQASWASMWSAADDCTHPSFRAYYDAACSWVSHGMSRAAFLFPAFQNYIDYDVSPTVTITSPNGGGWYRSVITVSATASDSDNEVAFVDFWYSLDGGTWTAIGSDSSSPYSVSWDTGGISDPSVWVRAQALDGMKRGGFDLSDSSFGVDNARPSVAITSPSNGAVFGSASITVTGSSSDNVGVALVQVRVNGGAWQTCSPPTSPWSCSVLLSPGENTIEARATDNVGNTSPLASVTVTLDVVAPSVTITSPANGAVVNVPTLTISGTSSDNVAVAQVRVRVNGGSWQTCSPPTSPWSCLASLSPGVNTIEAQAVDTVGIVSSPSTVSVTLDTVPPSVSITSPVTGTIVNSQSIPASGTSSDNVGVVQVRIRINGGPWQTCSPPTSPWSCLVSLTDGLNTVEVQAVDLAGNLSPLESISVILDRTAPTVTITAPPSGAVVSTPTLSVSGTSSDNVAVAQVRVRVNGGSWQTCSPPTSPWSCLVSLAPGTNTIEAQALDTAGNPSPVTSVTVTLELMLTLTTSPSGLLIQLDGATHQAPYSIACPTGSTHMLNAPSPQIVGTTRYSFVSWSDGGLQSHEITCSGSQTYTASFSIEYQILIETSPTGREVRIEGDLRIAPHAFWCGEGLSRSIDAPSPQIVGTTRYSFVSWSDGGLQSHDVTCSSAATYRASFGTEYRISITSSPANRDVTVDTAVMTAPFTAWWVAGSAHSVDVPSPQTVGATRYVFVSWSDGGAKSRSIVMDEALTLTVTFRAQHEVTVDTRPTGLWVQVDGTWYQTPRAFWWDEGSTHTLGANNSQGGLNFVSWSDSGGRVHSVVVGGPATYTASYAAAPQPLTLVATADVTAGPAPLRVKFDATSSGGNGNYLWKWHFGDGATSTQASPSVHEYDRPGVYQARVWLNDTGGNTTSKSFTITVTAGPLVLSYCTVVPNPVALGLNGSQQFTAVGWSIEDAQIPGATVAWGVTGSIGTISATGWFTAGATEAAGTVDAQVTHSASTKTCFASVTVTSSPPPTVEITSPRNYAVVTAKSLIVTGTSTGADYVEVRIDSGSWQAVRGLTSWTLSLTDLSDGPHTIEARSFRGTIESTHVSVSITVTAIPTGDVSPSGFSWAATGPVLAALIAGLVALLVARRRKKPSPPAGRPMSGAEEPVESTEDVGSDLRRLWSDLQDGSMTQEEYDTKRDELLRRR